MDAALMSSAFHGWQTPEHVLELVRAVAPIALDPCTTQKNPTKARRYMTSEPAPAPFTADFAGAQFHRTGPFGWVAPDGLPAYWLPWCGRHGLTFVNPPYGRALAAWLTKCATEARLGTEILALVPARPDTSWFQGAARSAHECLFWRGRLKFTDPRAPEGQMWHSKKECFVPLAPAAFPSAFFYWGPNRERFVEVFKNKGLFLR